MSVLEVTLVCCVCVLWVLAADYIVKSSVMVRGEVCSRTQAAVVWAVWPVVLVVAMVLHAVGGDE